MRILCCSIASGNHEGLPHSRQHVSNIAGLPAEGGGPVQDAVPEPARSTLDNVRAAIRSAVPRKATEVISYQIPMFMQALSNTAVWFGE